MMQTSTSLRNGNRKACPPVKDRQGQHRLTAQTPSYPGDGPVPIAPPALRRVSRLSGPVELLATALLILSSSTALLAQAQARKPSVIDLAAIGISSPQGITYHPGRKTLFIVRKTPSEVFEVGLLGRFVGSFPVPISKPEGIAYDPVTGDLLICKGSKKIYRASADGSRVEPYLDLKFVSDVSGIAVHPVSGEIYVADDDGEAIWEIDRDGSGIAGFRTSLIDPKLTEPKGLSFYGTDLLVADDMAKTVYLVSPEGEMLQALISEEMRQEYSIKDFEGVAAVGQNRVCAVADNESKLFCFDLSQEPLIVPFRLDVDRSFVGVATVNGSSKANAVNGWGYSADGRNTAFGQFAPLPPLGQSASLTADFFAQEEFSPQSAVLLPDVGFEVDTLIVQGQRGPVQGFFLVGDSGLEKLDGIGGGLDAARQLYFALARNSLAEKTLLFLFNPALSGEAKVDLILCDSLGGVVEAVSATLAAQGSINRAVGELFSQYPTIQDGYVEVVSNLPLKGFQFFDEPRNLSAIPAQTGTYGRQLIAPHFFVTRGDAKTELWLLNILDAVIVTVTAFSDDGKPLDRAEVALSAKQMRVIDLSELLELDLAERSMLDGSLRLQVKSGAGPFASPKIAAALTYRGGNGASTARLALEENGRRKTIFPHVSQARSVGAFQGLALLNSSSKPVSAVVTSFDETGGLVAQTTLQMGANSRIIGLLDETVFFGPGFEQVGGYLEVTGSEPIITISLFGGANFLAAIEGQPSLPAPQ